MPVGAMPYNCARCRCRSIARAESLSRMVPAPLLPGAPPVVTGGAHIERAPSMILIAPSPILSPKFLPQGGMFPEKTT